MFETFLKVFEGNKKNCDVIFSIISFLNDQNNFKEIEARNRLNNNQTQMKNKFSFIKSNNEIIIN